VSRISALLSPYHHLKHIDFQAYRVNSSLCGEGPDEANTRPSAGDTLQPSAARTFQTTTLNWSGSHLLFSTFAVLPQAQHNVYVPSRSSLLHAPSLQRSRQYACQVAASVTASSGSALSSSRATSPQLLEMPPRNTAAVGSTIKYRIKKKAPVTAAVDNPVTDFMLKLKLAWHIFFPEAPAGSDVKPKEEAKQRLRMILVADRCGMSPAGLTEMKRNILNAIEEFVDIDSEEQIDVSITTEPEVGTVYCVAVPIKRVKPEARIAVNEDGDIEGLTFEYDPEDPNSDPSSQFPFGT